MPATVGPPGLAAWVLIVVSRSPKGTARISTVMLGLASVNLAATASSWATWSGPQWVRYEIVTGSWAAAGRRAGERQQRGHPDGPGSELAHRVRSSLSCGPPSGISPPAR